MRGSSSVIIIRGPLQVALVAALIAAPLRAQDRVVPASAGGPGVAPAPVRVPPAGGPIEIDGVLDEPAWQRAARLEMPYEWFPGDNIPAPVDTEVFLTFDANHIYVAFHAYDPDPSQIRAHVADRDTPFRNDHVGFIIDPFNDERRGFQFRINPLGVQMDAVFSELEGFEDFSWDAIWESAGRITDDGYIVEVAVPTKSLRFQNTDGEQTWGFIGFRSYPRAIRHRLRTMYTDRNRACLLCQAQKLTGFRGLTAGRNAEITPTLTATRTDARADFPAGDMENGDPDYEPGVTARWGITPNLTLNATANPDFSQVEADVAQLDVNNRFALFFPERRPFFLEGADFFLTPINAVFTRTVADPIAGAKLTGKQGSNALGVFVTRDRTNQILFPSNQGSGATSIGDTIDAAVVRFRRDIGNGSTVGGVFTAREGDGYHNRVGGVDAFWRISRSNTLSVQLLRSSTEYPAPVAETFGQPRDAFEGHALRVQVNRQTRDWFAQVTYEERDPDFRADAGFVPRVDTRSVSGFVNRNVFAAPGRWFSVLSAGVSASHTEDFDGETTDQSVAVFANYSGPLQSNFGFNVSRNRQRFAGELFDLTSVGFGGNLQPNGDVTVGLNGSYGDAVDFNNARKARQIVLVPNLSLRLGRGIELGASHTLQRLTRGGERVLLANLTQGRLLYHLNVRTFVRAIVQYRDVRRTEELFQLPVPPESRSLFAQFLFSYKLNPQTVVFLGYSENGKGSDTFDLTRSDRTFFVKLGYAWRP
ncbi:MAG: hypothetical protein D6701_13680 [Gemmatimonadetes bacterium]|nr:MAG: hypothetical protein D6701_13680 [Gemmatimonadota bacterium]